MQQVRHRRGSAVALVAVFVLVLQSFLSAWAVGAMPATPMLDAFGNPLCITSTDHNASGQSGDHSSLPNCCAFGCTFSSSVLTTGPDNGTGLLRPLSSVEVRFHLRRTVHIQSPDHDPGSPRAPPLTA